MGRIRLIEWGRLVRILSSSNYCIEVVDARNPAGTRSVRLERVCEKYGVRLLIAINKIDLVPNDVVWGWVRVFEREGFEALPISARNRVGTLRLRKKLRSIARELGRVAIGVVAGVPKTGKSTLINILRGKHGASTSPYPGSPGYTRHHSIYRIESKVYLYDTPGIVPDARDPLEKLIRIYPPEQLPDPVKAAVMLIERVLEHNPNAFLEAYGIESRSAYEILEYIARRRGWVEKTSGEPMIENAAVSLIRDYHSGKIRFWVKPPV